MTHWNTLFACALLSATAFADQTITLEDGKQVVLKDDFTWEYVPHSDTPSEEGFLSIPVANATKGTTIVIGDNKPSLQLSKSGVDILIGAGEYENGELTLPVSITNQSTQPVVLVTLNVAIYSPTGELLYEESTHAWQSIKRLAETYLRPQTSAKGKPLSMSVEQHPQYQISVEVSDISTR